MNCPRRIYQRDQGELVTIPALPDAAEWESFTAARLALRPNLSLDHAAALPAGRRLGRVSPARTRSWRCYES